MFSAIAATAAGLMLPAASARTLPAAQWAGLSAQSSSPLKGVRVYGSTRFTSQQLLAASGLHMGEDLTDARVQQAAKRLAATGAFSDVSADDFPGMGGEVIHFKVTDMLPLAACDFSAIHGIAAAQLLAELKRSVPLFDGRVPLANPRMLNAVRAQLQQILQKHGIHGRVVTAIQTAHVGGAAHRVVFHLSS
jgi:outer membrane protein assembly factor BamA